MARNIMSKAMRNAYHALNEYEGVKDWSAVAEAIENNTLVVSFKDTMNANLAKNILRELDRMEREERLFEKHGIGRMHDAAAYRVVRHSVEVKLQRERDFLAQF